MKRRVLVADDEPALADGIALNLEAEGYETTVVSDGGEALEAASSHAYDLLILDVMMPVHDGFEVCRRLRKRGNKVPIMFLTARGRPEDRIDGLRAGADDYLAKPFRLEELLLRVRAILRRVEDRGHAALNAVTFGDAEVNFSTYEAAVGGRRIALLAKECLLLKLLAEHAGEAVTRDVILDRVWGRDSDPTARTVDNYIVRLRKIFEPDPAHPRYIHTVRAVGYRFTPEGEGEREES